MNAPSPISPADIGFHRLGPDLCDILLRGRHIGTFERVPDLAGPGRRHIFRITILFDPERPREYRAIERPRHVIAELINGICNTAGPPPLLLQFHI